MILQCNAMEVVVLHCVLRNGKKEICKFNKDVTFFGGEVTFST